MKKGNFLRKLIAFLFLGFGALTLSACQSTNQNDAKIIIQDCSVQIFMDTSTGTRYATSTIAIKNDTIYDVKTWHLEWDTKLVGVAEPVHEEGTKDQAIAHGSVGYLVYTIKNVPANVESIKITAGEPVAFYNLWESYVVWWIIGIVILACSVIANAVEIFRKDIGFEEAKAIVAEHAANGIVIGLLILLICLFPLIWGAWFSTIILLITFAACGAAALLMLGIKSAGSKK